MYNKVISQGIAERVKSPYTTYIQCPASSRETITTIFLDADHSSRAV
jgi:hypothetical protein